MKPWLKRTFVGLFGASAMFGGMAACSHHSYGHHGWHSAGDEDVAKFKTRLVEKATSKLDLDTAQQGRLSVLIDRLHEQRLALRGATDPRQEVQSLIKDGTFDRWHAQDMVNARLNAVREKSPQVITAMGEFYDSLRPEQQARVREFLQRANKWGRG
jgi:periplasmic protein CpxP/Spy